YAAYSWTQQAGMTALPLPFGETESVANAVSADGSVIVGRYYETPALWRNGQAFTLSSPPNGQRTEATGVSADGKTIVGYCTTPEGDFFPVIWFSDEQWRRLDVLLTSQGVDLQGLSRLWPVAISPDGTVVTGNALDAVGHSIAWTAVIPGPSSSAL